VGEGDGKCESNDTKAGINSNQVGRVASWEGNLVVSERRQSGPLVNGSGREGIKAELIAGLGALSISAHPEGVSEGRLSFQGSLDGIMGGRAWAQ
jgi:hypothetical protein